MILKRAFILLTPVMLANCAGWNRPAKTDAASVSDGERGVYSEMRSLNTVLAGDVRSRMNWFDEHNIPYPDYDVKIYTGGPVIGSLIDTRFGKLVTSLACRPDAKIIGGDLSPTPINVFGSYSLTRELSASVGIPVPSMTVGGTASRKSESSFSYEDANLTLLSDDQLLDLVKSPQCAERIDKLKSGFIVRGIIKAKRSYKLSKERKGGLSLKIGALDNSANNTLSFVGSGQDTTQREYFMILTPLPYPARPDDQTLIIASPDGNVGSKCRASDKRIYLQRDADDVKTAGFDARTSLRSTFNVIPQIQGIDHDRMPTSTQVRYFSRDDKADADCAALLVAKAGYSDVKTVFLKIASPPNQMEVWLTKGGKSR